ncbi:MAG: hypothetical protein IPL78_27575 [Chloroflexi bacterium]|nr:hypothetical protein [Chloroflexota bacterium]
MDAAAGYPYWSWQLENAAAWTPTATLKITLQYSAPLASGRYLIKLTTPNGTSDDYIFSQ